MAAARQTPGNLIDRDVVSRSRRRSERHRLVAEGLRDLLTVVNSGRNLDEILDEILAQAGRLLDSDAGAVYLLDEHDKTLLAVRAYRCLDADQLAAKVRLGSPATGLATQMHRPVAVRDLVDAMPDIQNLGPTTQLADRGHYLEVVKIGGPPAPEAQDAAYARLQHLASRYRAVLAVPLAVPVEVFGALTLYYREPRFFTEEDVKLAMAFANQAALAIQNTKLHQRAQAAATLEERQRLARDLHDAVTQTLFSASLIAEVLPRTWRSDPAQGMRHLEDLRRLTRGALAEMRTLLIELRPTALVDTTFSDLLRQLAEATMGRRRLTVAVTVDGDCGLPPDTQVAFYRLAQEALNNVTKHAGAAHADVRLRRVADAVELSVADDGRGFDPALVPAGHLGVGIMRERARAIGAALEIDSRLGAGTRVMVRWRSTNQKKDGQA